MNDKGTETVATSAADDAVRLFRRATDGALKAVETKLGVAMRGSR
jgi:hypothetical protein